MNKLKGLISIAKKAGYVVIGAENLKNYNKKLFLLVIDAGAGNSLKREMNFLAQKRNLPLLEVENMADLVVIDNCKAIGIKNKCMSENIEKCLKGEQFGNTTI